jgi:lipoate-protein ligase B
MLRRAATGAPGLPVRDRCCDSTEQMKDEEDPMMSAIDTFADLATTVRAEWLGRIGYGPAWELQREVFDEVRRGKRENTLLLCEHPDVITLGRECRDDRNLIMSREILEANGYEVFDVDRGGDVTYHGPGQLVGYPIIRLADFKEDLGWYLRAVEELIIRTVAQYGIEAGRKPSLEGEGRWTGVWTDRGKICAIGVRASRWTTMHGFALNVTTDLARFAAIVPCGIATYPVTSIERDTGRAIPLEEVARCVAAAWDGAFA